MEANPDKDDSRSLHLVVQQPFARRSKTGFNPLPLLSAKFVFDDYIRCMSARQRLQKRRDALRHAKMTTVATLLELPVLAAPPAHYYSITAFDRSGSTVWSPSSRGYTSSRSGSSRSSPNLSRKEVGTSGDASPKVSQSKSAILSPEHDKILQKHKSNKSEKNSPVAAHRDRTDGDTILKQPPIQFSTPRHENTKSQASVLASVLDTSGPEASLESSAGPEEIAATFDIRERSSTVEVGEEECEEAVTLSESNTKLIPISNSTIERSTSKNERSSPAQKPPINRSKISRDRPKSVVKKSNPPTNRVRATIEKSASVDGPTKAAPAHKRTVRSRSLEEKRAEKLDKGKKVTEPESKDSCTEDSKEKTEDKGFIRTKCDSAPGSPRGRRERAHTADATQYKSLPSMSVQSRSLPSMSIQVVNDTNAEDISELTDEQRRLKAHRARAKAKSMKTKKLRR